MNQTEEGSGYTVRVEPDGFLRLQLDVLLSTRLVHVVSGLDDDLALDGKSCGGPTWIAGYTEWASETGPIVSLGWDWRIEVRERQPLCLRVGLPRSNVMLVDTIQRDYGWQKNLQALATIVDAMPWAEQTYAAVNSRYGWSPYYNG